MYSISETELILDCQEGSNASFAELVDKYRDTVFSTVFYIVGNLHDAEDIAQETFIAAYRAIRTFDANRRFAPWLMKIAANRAIDHMRRNSAPAGGLDSLEAISDGDPVTLDQNAADPLEAAEVSELHRLIEKCISKLPPKYSAVMTLCYFQELCYDEIADALEIPVGTVKTCLHRGRKILMAAMARMLGEPTGPRASN